jgi:hypothetical protein
MTIPTKNAGLAAATDKDNANTTMAFLVGRPVNVCPTIAQTVSVAATSATKTVLRVRTARKVSDTTAFVNPSLPD